MLNIFQYHPTGTVSDAFCPLLVEGFSIVKISNFVEQNFSQLYVKRADEELGYSPGDWELVSIYGYLAGFFPVNSCIGEYLKNKE